MSGAVIYVRVSTDEQADQTQNLPTQTRKMDERSKGDGVPVLKVFTDTESARTTNRKQFQAMLV